VAEQAERGGREHIGHDAATERGHERDDEDPEHVEPGRRRGRAP
jgi:hypothetical protein